MATKQEIRDREEYIKCLEQEINKIIEKTYDELVKCDIDQDMVEIARNFYKVIESNIEEIEMIKDNINE